MKAYNIAIGSLRGGAPQPGGQGWCFGLPPGIAPGQWPRDPVSGFPLMHGFTLLLPEDYRVHGPDIVALSFFATAPDGNDGGRAARGADVEAAGQHPRLHRMRDILHYDYAVLLLTQAEFDGAPCRPPAPPEVPVSEERAPAWLSRGSAVAYEIFSGRAAPAETGDRWMLHRPLTWSPREADPNAGLAPRESWNDEPAESGYQSFFYWESGVIETEAWREHGWASDHAENHIGGTMRPVQAMPEFSPFYIGFEEEMGGYNFGGGTAQLDFRDMEFDWACG